LEKIGVKADILSRKENANHKYDIEKKLDSRSNYITKMLWQPLDTKSNSSTRQQIS